MLYTDIYWQRRQVSERDGLFKNLTAKIDSLKKFYRQYYYYIIELLCTLFFVRIWLPCRVWSVVCKVFVVCWPFYIHR